MNSVNYTLMGRFYAVISQHVSVSKLMNCSTLFTFQFLFQGIHVPIHIQPSTASPAQNSPERITASPARMTVSPAHSISSLESSGGNRLQIVTSPLSIVASPSSARHADEAGSSLLKSLLTKSAVANVGQFPPPASGFAFPPGEFFIFIFFENFILNRAFFNGLLSRSLKCSVKL